eukprot:5502053-Karenia_brevis.AAC.1
MINRFENTDVVREKLVIGIHSGAAVTICPEKVAADYPIIEESNGTWYRTAGGGRVPDGGKKIIEVIASGQRRLISTRVGPVTKFLMAANWWRRGILWR